MTCACRTFLTTEDGCRGAGRNSDVGWVVVVERHVCNSLSGDGGKISRAEGTLQRFDGQDGMNPSNRRPITELRFPVNPLRACDRRPASEQHC